MRPPLFFMVKNARSFPVLLWTFFYISAVTLGGGMAMLPVIQREFVERRRWLDEDEMVELIAITHAMPGIIAVNMAVLVGHRICGIVGAIGAAFAAVLAPFAAIVLVASGRSALTGCAAIDHAFLGVRAAVTALILLAAVRLARNILVDPLSVALATAGFVACAFCGASVVAVLLVGVAVGLAVALFRTLRAGRKGADRT